MQIGIVAKKIGLSVDAIRFYERNALAPATAKNAGRIPSILRKRRGHARFYPPRAGPGIQTQRDPWNIEPARESIAALRSCEAPTARKAGRCSAETCRPAQARTRTAIGTAQLQK